MNRKLTNILVTGGAGFIGSNFIRHLFEKTAFAGRVVNYDKLTYAGNRTSLEDIESEWGASRYFFEQGDICNGKRLAEVLARYQIDTVVHFAAESHVDRSIDGPADFIETNIVGTFTLLEALRDFWNGRDDVLFHHVSTDEVYGSLGETGAFREETPYDPRSPYSASKAASDHLVNAYFHTYNLPVTLSNCSNNYGPYHFPEKLIPLMIEKALAGQSLPVYGDGKNVRDWLYVEDHAAAIWLILNRGVTGESYNVGGENEWENLKLVRVLLEKLALLTDKPVDHFVAQIQLVPDRPGHDRRYAIDCTKIKTKLGWKPSVSFEEGLEKTLQWYLDHQDWVKNLNNEAQRAG